MLVQIFLQDFRAKKNRNVKGKFKKKKNTTKSCCYQLGGLAEVKFAPFPNL